MESLQPDIYIGTLRLSEPVIALTGLFMAMLCGYAWWRLHLLNPANPQQRWMQHFFVLMGLSALIGAIFGHLLYYQIGFAGKYASWIFSIFSLGALTQAAIEHARPLLSKSTFRYSMVFNLTLVILAINLTGFYRDFRWVEVHSAAALFGIFAPLVIYTLKKRQDLASRLLLWSLLPAAIAVIPHVIKWSPHIWFSYFDVGHLVLLTSFWLLMQGAEKMT